MNEVTDLQLRAYALSTLSAGGVVRDKARACIPDLVRAAREVADAVSAGGKLLTFGNGGSAADAQHLAAEFVGRFRSDRAALAAVALTTDSSALTAIGNDYGFDQIFSRQVAALGRPEDVIVAMSTSGKSPNVLAGIEGAKALGAVTIGFSGEGPNPLSELVDIAICVPSSAAARVQECHLALEHLLCECVEAILFPDISQDLHDVAPTTTPVPPRAETKVVDLEDLARLREEWRHDGKVVVWTNGCFDLLHAGHLQMLEASRSLGDVLVVGVNDDQSVKRIKGDNRPFVPAQERAALVAAMEAVDRVVVFQEDTPEACLRRLEPEIHTKGADYAPPAGKPIPEAATVESYGGRVEFIPLVPSRSSTTLIGEVI